MEGNYDYNIWYDKYLTDRKKKKEKVEEDKKEKRKIEKDEKIEKKNKTKMPEKKKERSWEKLIKPLTKSPIKEKKLKSSPIKSNEYPKNLSDKTSEYEIDINSHWQTHYDPCYSRNFYYNPFTKESVWELPQNAKTTEFENYNKIKEKVEEDKKEKRKIEKDENIEKKIK